MTGSSGSSVIPLLCGVLSVVTHLCGCCEQKKKSGEDEVARGYYEFSLTKEWRRLLLGTAFLSVELEEFCWETWKKILVLLLFFL